MNDEVKKIILNGESETVEFKESTAELQKAIETLSAFLNHKGGTIFFGITDKGKIIGQEVSDSTLKKISNAVITHIEPKIFPNIFKQTIEDRTVLVMEIPEGLNKPYFAYGRAFKRVGTTNHQLSRNELEQVFLQYDQEKFRWDKRLCETAALNNISTDKVKRFVRAANEVRNLIMDEHLLLSELLEKLELIDDQQQLTNACVALFAENPHRFYDTIEIRCAHFKGLDKNMFLDNKVFTGDLFQLLEAAESFILSKISLRGEITEDALQRKERLEYPKRALREAIVNAVAHRDYADFRACVQISIFDDRIEIWNPGSLPVGWTVDDLKKPHTSKPQNPLIANILFLRGLIERWGRGTQNMVEECLNAGLPEPAFKQHSGGFEVTFRKYMNQEQLDELGLNERQQSLFEFFKEHKQLTTKDYLKLFPSITERTAQRDMNELITRGLIKKVNNARKKISYEIKI